MYLLPSHYTFEWDQEDDAIKVMGMINSQKPLLIGPRVASENGFFVAPWHYYFLTPFYLVTAGDPIAGGYAAITVWGIFVCLLFILSRKMFGYPVALLSLVIVSFSFSFTSWNAMYAGIFAILIFYLCYGLINKPSTRIFLLLCFFYGLSATTHLVPVSLIIPIIFSVIISGYRPSLKNTLIGLFLVLMYTLPLFIFDLRHQFLNFHKIIEFITTSSASEGQSIFLRTFWRSLSLSGTKLFLIERLFWLLIFFLSFFLLKNIRHRYLVIVWFLTPIIGLSLYRGDIPEYYNSLLTSILPLFLSLAIIKFKPLIVPPLILGCLSSFLIITAHPLINLTVKKNIIKYFATNFNDQPFFLSFEFPIGQSNGYKYLLDFYQLKPTDSAPLYTLHPSRKNVSGTTVYQIPEGLSITKR